MTKYVKALDYMVCATQAYRKGNVKLAAKLLKAAAAHPSRVMASKIVDKINNRAIAAAKTARTRTRAAASWPFRVRSESDIIPPDSLDEFGLEPNVNDFRAVQEAEFEDDLTIESEGFDEEDDLTIESEGFDDDGFGVEDINTLSSEFEDEDLTIESSDEFTDEEDAVEQARFLRALRNQRASRTTSSLNRQKKGRPFSR